MTDPFTSLRRTTERAEPDPGFREALLSDVRLRLADQERPGSADPTTTTSAISITLEATHMEPNPRSRTRWLLMAAAAIVAIAGVTAVVVTRPDADDDATSTTQLGASDSAPDSAALPTTTMPATTTLPTTTTTTLQPLTDADIANAVLLPAAEYAPGWNIQPPPRPAPTDVLQADIAATITACAPYIADVFEADDGVTVRNRVFYHGPPTEALIAENVFVFANEESAIVMFDAINDAGFPACAAAYGDKATICPVEVFTGCTVESFGTPAVDPPFDPVGDQLRFSRYESTWIHAVTGESHGPEEMFGATVRVGRIIVYTGTLHMGDAGGAANVEVVSEDQFRQTLVNIVDRAESALAGTPKV